MSLDNTFTSDYCLHAAQFTVQPVSVIQTEGLEAVFECLYPGATYTWFVNGVHPTDINFPSDIVAVAVAVSGNLATLTIPARPEYNNIVVQCEAIVRVGGCREFVLSDNAMLTVFG